MVRGFFFLFLSVLSISARAQTDKAVLESYDREHEIDIQIGAFRPTARFDFQGASERFGSTGFIFTADYLHRVTPAISAGFEGIYINRGNSQLKPLATNPGSRTLVRGDTKALLATVRVIRPGAGIRPYVLGGIGGHVTTMDMFIQAPNNGIWVGGFGNELTAVRGDASGLIWVLRAGVERAFSDGGIIGLEAGWIGISSHRYARTEAGRTIVGLPADVNSRADGISLTAKFGYRFR